MNQRQTSWKSLFGLLLPVICAIVVSVYGGEVEIPALNSYLPRSIQACLVGMLIAVVLWLIMKYILKGNDALRKGLLCGLLCAEVMLFSHKDAKVKLSQVSLWLFFYFNAIEHDF